MNKQLEEIRQAYKDIEEKATPIEYTKMDRQKAIDFISNFVTLKDDKPLNLAGFVGYNPFDSPDENLLVNDNDKIQILKRFGLIDDKYSFKDVEPKLFIKLKGINVDDLSKNKVLMIMVNKLMMVIHSDVESAFKLQEDDYPLELKKCLKLDPFMYMIPEFSSAFDNEMKIINDSNSALNEIIPQIMINPHEVMAMLLKNRFGSISYDYYLAYKYTCLVLLMIQNKFEEATIKETTLLGEVLYEANEYIMNQVMKAIPKYENLSDMTKGYYLAHFRCGPQYRLFKKMMTALRSI